MSATATEFTYVCNECGDHQSWTNEPACQAAAAWHIHDKHPGLWRELIGDREPQDPRPETLGRRFENWELQS